MIKTRRIILTHVPQNPQHSDGHLVASLFANDCDEMQIHQCNHQDDKHERVPDPYSAGILIVLEKEIKC